MIDNNLQDEGELSKVLLHEADSLEGAIDTLCWAAATNSELKGFHDNDNALRALTMSPELRAHLDTQLVQAEYARIASEVGEAVEGARKPCPDQHLPQYDSQVVELADVLIRAFDTAGKRGWPLGEAVIAKMRYNATRPRLHGKNS